MKPVKDPTRGPHDRLLGYLSAVVGTTISAVLLTYWITAEGWADEMQGITPAGRLFLEILALVGPGAVLVVGGLFAAWRRDGRN